MQRPNIPLPPDVLLIRICAFGYAGMLAGKEDSISLVPEQNSAIPPSPVPGEAMLVVGVGVAAITAGEPAAVPPDPPPSGPKRSQ